MMRKLIIFLIAFLSVTLTSIAKNNSLEKIKGKKILFIERMQYLPDHHNSATLFQVGEINERSFRGGSAMRIFDVDTKKVTTLIESKDGVVRDPELSYDAKKIIFSMRKNKEDFYHIYEMNVDGSNLKQLTFAKGSSDVDPVYLPNGDIIFTSTRQPKYCMCNRHIMGNLFRMQSDGANIMQLSVNTLFDSHAFVMQDGRILYDRWEYVDRNFGDAQGLWTANPDGTRHAIYFGNNTSSPGGIIDARQIPNTDLVVCIFGSCHDRPWGALAVLDRSKGVDGNQSVLTLIPESSKALLGKGGMDSFKRVEYYMEDPLPLDRDTFLVSLATRTEKTLKNGRKENIPNKSDIYLMNSDGSHTKIISGKQSLFDPMIIEPRPTPKIIADTRDDSKDYGTFYVQNVYDGTHMKGVKKGDAKYIRVVETLEKRTWTRNAWFAQGQQAPAVNWDGFEVKKIIGEAEIEDDGSVAFNAPANKFLYFQLLDKDKKMIQSMRSGTMLMPGEVYGCIGCHEDRLAAPIANVSETKALKKAPQNLKKWLGKEVKNFSYMENVQPVLDKHCVECHDFSTNEFFQLSGDKNPYFNASYVNLHTKKLVNVVGAGPAKTKEARSWGSSVSKLAKVINSDHNDIKLSDKEKEIIYTWIDINAPYYPTFETSFDNPSGRSPLTNPELQELSKLTNLDFIRNLNSFNKRKLPAQISFDRPELSPCLQKIKDDKVKYNRALALIKIGAKRLEEKPRGDIECELVVEEKMQKMLDRYDAKKAEMQKFKDAIIQGKKHYETAVPSSKSGD